MKIDTGLFVISAVISTMVLWVICSLIVLTMSFRRGRFQQAAIR